jgi:L-aspartate oxidase
LEGLVFGARAAQAMLVPGEDIAPFSFLALGADKAAYLRAPRDGGQTPSEEDVRSLMWNAVGLLRDGAGLQIAVERLDAWYAALGSNRDRVASLVTVGRLMAHAALRREETRGGHARTDFPRRDDVKFRIHFGEKSDV